jgi:hypothetical protein
LLIARLEQQLAFGRRQLALHAGLPRLGGAFIGAIKQLTGCEQREHGDKQQGTGNTHFRVS